VHQVGSHICVLSNHAASHFRRLKSSTWESCYIIQVAVYWFLAPSNVVGWYWQFGHACVLHFHGWTNQIQGDATVAKHVIYCKECGYWQVWEWDKGYSWSCSTGEWWNGTVEKRMQFNLDKWELWNGTFETEIQHNQGEWELWYGTVEKGIQINLDQWGHWNTTVEKEIQHNLDKWELWNWTVEKERA
jgi:hypothetical protein